jgi:two-component system sensor histidine kinase KdpD
MLPKNGHLVLNASSAGKELDSSELPAAEWAFQQGRPAGHNTGTFSYASYRYFPLETSSGIIGVLGVYLAGVKPEMHPEQVQQLGVYVTKAASAIERTLFAEEASQAEILRATEKLQTALLNSISHDLRTPLASITGVLSSLRMDEDWLDPQTRRELVETGFDEAERLNRLVGNLLDMSRLESGSLKISFQPCDIQDLIGAALNALTTRVGNRQVKVQIPPDLPLIPLDFVLVNQVVINLLDNAVKYSPEPEPILIRASQQGEFFEIDVEDYEPGIPEEDLERIFEKFYRSDPQLSRSPGGTGLGLYISRELTQRMGGRLDVRSTPGRGTTFVIELPRS